MRSPRAIVVDASVCIWAVLPSMAAADAVSIIQEWRTHERRLCAPPLWLPECLSAVRHAVARGSISPAQGHDAVDDLLDLEIEIVPGSPQQCHRALDWAARLGQARAYDATYVALAEDLGAEFWTADRRLANAAHQAGAVWVHAVE
jgi:predicted nucleic acid-binding protein